MAVRALIADGTRAVRNAIRLHLECIGCDVVAEVGTVAQALAIFRTVKPDVVTLGLDLPSADEMDSVALFREMRREAPATTIVLLGGNEAQAPDEEVFVREGALGLVARPFGSASFDLLWRGLSEAHPELRNRGLSAIMSDPFQQGRTQNRQTA
jgi:AmiR/NasT family two-component response regulator